MARNSIPMTVSAYTTDVEFRLRTWKQDGAMVRFVGIAVEHKYLSRGGHRLTNAGEKKRHEDTSKAIHELCEEFQESIRFEKKPRSSRKQMQYKFRHVGPKPIVFKDAFTANGAKLKDGSGAILFVTHSFRYPFFSLPMKFETIRHVRENCASHVPFDQD